jgi:hypothetical protein
MAYISQVQTIMDIAGIDFKGLISDDLKVGTFYNWHKLNVMTYHHGRS